MFRPNPVLVRELQTQLRGIRATVLISVFVGLLMVALVFMYRTIASRAGLGAPLLNAQIGQALFAGMAMLLQTLMVFVAPAITVSGISGEHERNTLSFVLMTPLAGWRVLSGQLLAAGAFLLLLLCSVAPLFSVVLLFGGVRLIDMGRAAALVLATGLAGLTLGAFCSALVRRTAGAAILCYTLLVALIGGTLFAASFWSATHSLSPAPPSFVYANPLSAMASALALAPAPGTAGGQDVAQFTPVNQGMPRPLALVGMFAQGTLGQGPQGLRTVPIYRATLVLLGIGSLLLVWASARLIDRRRGWRPSLSDGVMLALVVAAVVAAYLGRGWWQVGG